MDNPIQVEALTKSYASFPAVKGIDFEVALGEVFGLLGPNGAGTGSERAGVYHQNPGPDDCCDLPKTLIFGAGTRE